MKKTIFFLLLAVLGLSAWQFWPQKDEMAGWWENEARRVELTGELDLAKFKLKSAGEVRGPEELDGTLAANDRREAQIAALKTKREELILAIERGEEALVKLGADRIRQLKERAIGREWAELATAARTYHEVKVISVTDAGVTIRHRDGSARLGYRDLTDSQRREFGLDQGTALAAAEEEMKRAAAYEQWLDDQAAEKERNKAAAARILSRPASRLPAPVVSANVAPVANPLKEPARQFGNGSRYNYYGSSYQRPRRTNVYYYYNAASYCSPRPYCSPVRPIFSRPPSSPTPSTTP